MQPPDNIWITKHLKSPIPGEWQLLEIRLDGYMFKRKQITVIISGSIELDNKRWIHLSIAHPKRMPKWSELVELRDIFLGSDKLCIQVLPAKSKHVNIHKFCLHIWHCVDGNLLPDFTQGMNTI